MHVSIVKLMFVLSLLTVTASGVLAQGHTFSDPNVDYTFDLPDATWLIKVKPIKGDSRAEFDYGYPGDGHLQIRKETSEREESPNDLLLSYRDQKLQFLPGYAEGKQERFDGRLRGIVYSYEFTQAGKPMSGRIYLLKANDRTVYALLFTGLRDKLRLIRNQTDSIARTFTVVR